jgi:hypothetical protein
MKYPLALAAFALVGVSALAHPTGTDPDAEWFSRQENIRQQSCCSEADGHRVADTDWRTTGNAYEVRIDGAWRPIAAEHALRKSLTDPNPTGGAVVWTTHGSDGKARIWCFSPGWQS